MPDRFYCPSEGCDKSYASLSALKTHMGNKHGGYTPEEIAKASEEPAEVVPVVEIDDGESQPIGESEPPPPVIPMASAEPKRISKKSRDLNDALNSAIGLAIKHLTKGLDDTEKLNLDSYREQVTTALIGIEFDFEEKLITLRSKVWLLISIALLYLVERMPTIGTMWALLKEQQKEKKPKAAEVAKDVN